MNDVFVYLLFGHLFGDYMLQNKWMALKKSASHWVCLVHCLVYTLAIALFTYPITNKVGFVWLAFIFLTHYPIDRWSLADKWLKLIDSRSLGEFLREGHLHIPPGFDRDNYRALRGGFTSFVYAIVDNTMHLTLMYFGYLLFFRG
jgi:hypothetical protein